MKQDNLEYRTGDILKSEADALVNPVNCVGVMGAGLAKQFGARYSYNLMAYKAKCKRRSLAPGDIMASYEHCTYVINVATKDHWKDKSRVEWVQSGLAAIRHCVEVNFIKSVAIPALGCGLGGLDWADVKPLLENFAASAPGVKVFVYLPKEKK